MEIEYNNIYYQIKSRPSFKCVLVAIPFYMYRIETNKFDCELNFFQKLVLKFKAKPGIKDETISEYTGIDPRLISIVTFELKSKGLINEYGTLSEQGKEKLLKIDGLVVNSDEREIGYVFKYVNVDKLYPYYINKIVPVDLVEYTEHPQIITSTKIDGDDFIEHPFYLDDIYKSKIDIKRPEGREILELINNTYKRSNNIEYDEFFIDRDLKRLSIRFINEKPDMVWICTYIYLKQNEDETYDPDWRVLDPFGFGDNVALKFYISNPINKNLLDYIQQKFADVKILRCKIFSEYQKQLNEQIEEKKLTEFLPGFNGLDKNLQMYIEAIIKYMIILEEQNYNDLDASVAFSLNLQNALENILKQDKEERKKYYELVYSNFDHDSSKKRKILDEIYQLKVFSNNIVVPPELLSVSKSSLSKKKSSLLSFLVSFILTYKFDRNSILFKILKDRIEIIIEIAKLRNEKSHGQISAEKDLKPLSKEQVHKFYNFIKTFLNDYIKGA